MWKFASCTSAADSCMALLFYLYLRYNKYYNTGISTRTVLWFIGMFPLYSTASFVCWHGLPQLTSTTRLSNILMYCPYCQANMFCPKLRLHTILNNTKNYWNLRLTISSIVLKLCWTSQFRNIFVFIHR